MYGIDNRSVDRVMIGMWYSSDHEKINDTTNVRDKPEYTARDDDDDASSCA